MPPKGSGVLPEQKEEELATIVNVLVHVFKQKRKGIKGPPRLPQLPYHGYKSGDPMYADADVNLYGTFGARLMTKLKSAVNTLRAEQGRRLLTTDDSMMTALVDFSKKLPFENSAALASYVAASREAEPEAQSERLASPSPSRRTPLAGRRVFEHKNRTSAGLPSTTLVQLLL